MSASQRDLPKGLAIALVVLATARLALELSPRLANAGMNDESIAWLSHDDAVAESARSGKPILLEFSADWCAPCRRMDAETWSDERVAETIARYFVPVRLVNSRDPARNRPADEALREAQGVEAFPTLIVLTPGSRRLARVSGFQSPQETRRFLESAAIQHLAAQNARRRLSEQPPASKSR